MASKTVFSTTSGSDAVLQMAVHQVLVPKPEEVVVYLDQNQSLAQLLPEICRQVRHSFGPSVELSLEIYKDPEIEDRYLTLYARQERYDGDLLSRLESISEGFNPELESIPGYFLLATDFRRPRGANGI